MVIDVFFIGDHGSGIRVIPVQAVALVVATAGQPIGAAVLGQLVVAEIAPRIAGILAARNVVSALALVNAVPAANPIRR